ncbi:C45 family autoproteolytic acyltransferase/hydolase [Streptacidiphilus griseoplanus]|uniref:C45 family autoproteolytic acyltransferase/hydolase n=1 Tax=Peterkaempfera griseoplana TaxID=66896 RepID=UPI0006E3D29C|nr:C45 family peptidase [Peterkaempfera griseoplana]
MSRRLTFTALDVGDGSDGRWAAAARAAWLDAAPWYTGRGGPEAERLLAERMPELLPVLDRLAAGLDRPGGRAALAHAGLRPFFSGCTQAAVDGVLLRNYDFAPAQCSRTVVSSRFLRPVIGMQELFWGLLDGMNDAGLAVSLTFGGRFVHGPGFSVLLVLRYLLETCDSVGQALDALGRLPVATAQNLTLVDASRALTVQVGPDLEPTVTSEPYAANHQSAPVPQEQERLTRTRQRLAAVREAARSPDAVLAALLRPPLHQPRHDDGMGTLYTAVYRPAVGRVGYHWPGEPPWEQSFAAFTPGSRTVTVGRTPGEP